MSLYFCLGLSFTPLAWPGAWLKNRFQPEDTHFLFLAAVSCLDQSLLFFLACQWTFFPYFQFLDNVRIF